MPSVLTNAFNLLPFCIWLLLSARRFWQRSFYPQSFQNAAWMMYVVFHFQVWLSHMVSSCFCMHRHLIYCWAHCWMDIFPSFNIWKQSGRFPVKAIIRLWIIFHKYLLRSLCMNIGFHCSGINTSIPWVVLVTRLTLIRNCRLGCDSVLECVPNIWDFLERERILPSFFSLLTWRRDYFA